jgi:sugar O-acyltransferase (sialic acid O-acetyltransferase NeuD family)
MQNTQKVLILGAGRLAVDLADMIEDIPGWSVVGFVVDQPPFDRGSKVLERPVYWIDEVGDLDHTYMAVCAIGSSKRAGIIQAIEEHGFQFTKVVHPSARVSKSAMIGPGTIISAGAQVAAQATIGRHVIVNRGALVGPFDAIHDYSYIAPGANLAANVTVGSRTWIGLGANILERLSIGEQSIVGAGSLVTKDVPSRVKVVGVPAMVLEKDIQAY